MSQTIILAATADATLQEFIREHFDLPARGIRVAMRAAVEALTLANPQLTDPDHVVIGDQLLIPEDFVLSLKPGVSPRATRARGDISALHDLLRRTADSEADHARRALLELDETMQTLGIVKGFLRERGLENEAQTLPDRVEVERAFIEQTATARIEDLRELQASLDEFAAFLEA